MKLKWILSKNNFPINKRNNPKFLDLTNLMNHSVISPPPKNVENPITFQNLDDVEYESSDNGTKETSGTFKLIPETFVEK